MVFIVDIRRGNLDLHLMYKALFELSADRAEFVSRLFSKKRPDGLTAKSTVAEIFGAFATVPASNRLFNDNLKAIDNLLVKKHGLALSTDDVDGIRHVYNAFYSYGQQIQYSSTSSFGGSFQPDYAELMTASDLNGVARSYLANEDHFKFMKDLEGRNMLVPVVGNFGGPKAIRAVGRYLKERNATVSAFYLSNVEQYLRQEGIWDELLRERRDAAARRNQHVHSLRAPPGRRGARVWPGLRAGQHDDRRPELPALRTPMPLLVTLLLLFVGSGCAALIYEIVWFQLLQLVIGSSIVSLGVLLGTFMGGMCLGSLLLPRMVSARHHPLRVYAALELGIGIIGLLLLWGMPLISGVYTAWAGSGAGGLIVRGLIAAICLLPPTLLMGATLPAVARWVETTPQGVSWLGFFYGGNIAGAVIGCLAAGFYLLRVYDTSIATYVAVALNLARRRRLAAIVARTAPADRDRARGRARERDVKPAPGAWAIYVAIGLSGMTALSAEVIWTRILSLLFGATVYTFSLILAVFLIGLGIGSSLGAAIGRGLERPRVALGICQVLLCAAIAWTAYVVDGVAPVLADQPVDGQQSVVYAAARPRALPVGDAAGRDPVGRELSAGAGVGRLARPGSGAPGRRRLCGQHGRRHRRRRSARASCWWRGSAASTRSRC